MIKKILFAFVIAAGLASCSEDYTDWANAQSNAQEAANNVVINITPGAAVNFTDSDPEKVKLFDGLSISAPNDMTPTSYQVELELTDTKGNPVKKTFDADANGEVATADLKAAVLEVCGKYPTERTVKTTAKVGLKNDKGLACYALSNQVDNHATPENFGKAYKLVYNDGEEVELTTSEDTYPEFKVSFKANANSSWTINNADGDPVGEGTVGEEGKYNLTYNAESAFAEAKKAPTELYLTGDHYNWGGSESDWKHLTPVYGTDGDFWTMIYLHADEQFKFAPQAGWGDDFGYIGAEKINDEANAGVVKEGGNLKVTNAGWYLIHVTNDADRAIEFLKPEVYVFGPAVGGKWDFDSAPK